MQSVGRADCLATPLPLRVLFNRSYTLHRSYTLLPPWHKQKRTHRHHRQLVEQFEGDPLHGGFVDELRAGAARPIARSEVPEAAAAGAVDAAEAAAFATKAQAGAAAPVVAAAAAADDDEFADME